MMRIGIALAALAAFGASAYAFRGPKAYYGTVEGASKPAEVVAATVFKQIGEFVEIKKRGLTEEDPEYWVLLNRASEKFHKAVEKVAAELKHDVVVEKGTAKFEGDVPDVSQKVIDAIEK